MRMEVRVQPFSVHLRLSQPRSSAGQEVCYVEGKHGGKMRVRTTGLGSLLGFIALAPDDPRVRDKSRHSITEAGLGNMLEQFLRPWEEQPADDVIVRVDDSVVAGRLCRRVEVILFNEEIAGRDAQEDWYRGELHIDQQTHLPIRVEYDNRNGDLLEEATYAGLKINPGLDDAIFGR